MRVSGNDECFFVTKIFLECSGVMESKPNLRLGDEVSGSGLIIK